MGSNPTSTARGSPLFDGWRHLPFAARGSLPGGRPPGPPDVRRCAPHEDRGSPLFGGLSPIFPSPLADHLPGGRPPGPPDVRRCAPHEDRGSPLFDGWRHLPFAARGSLPGGRPPGTPRCRLRRQRPAGDARRGRGLAVSPAADRPPAGITIKGRGRPNGSGFYAVARSSSTTPEPSGRLRSLVRGERSSLCFYLT